MSMDESPFRRPKVMDGYPLDPEEREAIERLLSGSNESAVTDRMIERGARVFAGDKAVSDLDRRWAEMVLRAALEDENA